MLPEAKPVLADLTQSSKLSAFLLFGRPMADQNDHILDILADQLTFRDLKYITVPTAQAPLYIKIITIPIIHKIPILKQKMLTIV